MNRDRFIELLNLYLDNELSVQETGELMDAVSGNEQYHALYLEYCRIHKACSRFKLEPKRSRIAQVSYALGGLAAAAALMVMATQNIAPFFQNAADGRPALLTHAVSPDDEYVYVMDAHRIVTPSRVNYAQLVSEEVQLEAASIEDFQPRFVVEDALSPTYSLGENRGMIFERAARLWAENPSGNGALGANGFDLRIESLRDDPRASRAFQGKAMFRATASSR